MRERLHLWIAVWLASSLPAAALAECRPEPGDGASRLLAGLRDLPMDARALDGWLLVPSGPTGCAPVAMSLVHPKGAIERAKALAGAAPGAKVIFYVNGVANTPEIECEVMRGIEAATGKTVIGVYNGTDGLARDVLSAMNDAAMTVMADGPAPPGPSADEAVRSVRAVVISEIFAGRPPEIWAHSQGAAIASLGMMEAREPLARQRRDLSGVRVTTFAAATDVWPAGPRYEHYVHRGDLVPVVSGFGDAPRNDAHVAVRVFGKGGVRTSANHDVLATYLPAWQDDHRRSSSW